MTYLEKIINVLTDEPIEYTEILIKLIYVELKILTLSLQ